MQLVRSSCDHRPRLGTALSHATWVARFAGYSAGRLSTVVSRSTQPAPRCWVVEAVAGARPVVEVPQRHWIAVVACASGGAGLHALWRWGVKVWLGEAVKVAGCSACGDSECVESPHTWLVEVGHHAALAQVRARPAVVAVRSIAAHAVL
jgi:hypothetical protein